MNNCHCSAVIVKVMAIDLLRSMTPLILLSSCSYFNTTLFLFNYCVPLYFTSYTICALNMNIRITVHDSPSAIIDGCPFLDWFFDGSSIGDSTFCLIISIWTFRIRIRHYFDLPTSHQLPLTLS